MPTFIKTGYWDKKAKAPKEWLDLDLLISQHAGSGATVVTKTGIDTLITTSGLTPGAYYIIEGVDVPLYGGTTIIIQAATTNTLALAGHGIFYNPKYDDNNIWNSTAPSYAIGQSVAWGGRVWNNLTGNTGFFAGEYELSSADWEVIPFTNPSYYNVVADVIHYDYQHDKIIRRKDSSSNDVDLGIGTYLSFIYGNTFPIKDFQWGNGPQNLNINGVYGNYVKDSYFGCLNFSGARLRYNSLTSFSQIYNIVSHPDCIIESNVLQSNSQIIIVNFLGASEIASNTLTSSQISGNTFGTTGGIISSNTLVNSVINDNTLNNGYIYRNVLTTLSFFSNNTLTDSQIVNNSLFDSYLTNNVMTNNSFISNNTLTNGVQVLENTLDSSNIIHNVLNDNNSKILFSTLVDSIISYNKINTSIFNFAASGTLTSKTISGITANYGNLTSNISSATIIYGNYPKQLFTNSAGVIRLGYYNASNVFTVVNVNA